MYLSGKNKFSLHLDHIFVLIKMLKVQLKVDLNNNSAMNDLKKFISVL